MTQDHYFDDSYIDRAIAADRRYKPAVYRTRRLLAEHGYTTAEWDALVIVMLYAGKCGPRHKRNTAGAPSTQKPEREGQTHD